MVGLSSTDHSVSPPSVRIPREYNVAYDLIERNLTAGRDGKVAFIDDHGRYTYGELADRVNRFANALTRLGLEMENRIALCLVDTIDFPTAFLGSIKAGIIPIPISTMLTTPDYEYILTDSRARALIVSESLLPLLAPLAGKLPFLRKVIVSGKGANGHIPFSALLADGASTFMPAETTCDDICFWLYSSGSTGRPKGAVHLHSSLIQTTEFYPHWVLDIEENDVIFSSAKLCFAYGLGIGLTFPMSVGATGVLMADRPTPEALVQRLIAYQPTIFAGPPTLYSRILANPELLQPQQIQVRRWITGGEPLAAEIGRRWTERFGIDLLDGLGATEMLHIYLSSRTGEVRYGATGKPVPGYELRIVDDAGNPVMPGEVGELQISGPTSAVMYWNNRERSLSTFRGKWTRSGDRYRIDDDGYYVFCGRGDDMIKVGGIYVSPIEVEATLMEHEAVLEAAVVAFQDEDKLMKSKAFVVLKPGYKKSDDVARALQLHVKGRLAPYKYPRRIEFIDELPKTPSGKIQRFRLRTGILGS